jgi:hypothetical protein
VKERQCTVPFAQNFSSLYQQHNHKSCRITRHSVLKQNGTTYVTCGTRHYLHVISHPSRSCQPYLHLRPPAPRASEPDLPRLVPHMSWWEPKLGASRFGTCVLFQVRRHLH